MSLQQFRRLDEMEQAEFLWEHEPIEFREDETFRYALYQIDDFYVEVRYHTQHNFLTGIWAFDDTEELGPYLAGLPTVEGLIAPKRYTIEKLTKEALEIIPDRYLDQIRQHPAEKLIELHPTIGRLLRTELYLWQRKVEDEQGGLIHPDDVSLTIMKAINSAAA